MGNEWARYPCHTCESVPAQVLTCLVEFSGACFFCISATRFTGQWKIMHLLQPFSHGLGLIYLLACVCNVTAALADAYGTHETVHCFFAHPVLSRCQSLTVPLAVRNGSSICWQRNA